MKKGTAETFITVWLIYKRRILVFKIIGHCIHYTGRKVGLIAQNKDIFGMQKFCNLKKKFCFIYFNIHLKNKKTTLKTPFFQIEYHSVKHYNHSVRQSRSTLSPLYFILLGWPSECSPRPHRHTPVGSV